MRDLIRAVRKLKNLTLREVSNYVGINKSAIGNFELGITSLSVETIRKICDFLEIDFETRRFRRQSIFYFYIKSGKDWIEFGDLMTIKRILNVSEIICFANYIKKNTYIYFILLYEFDTENFYILQMNKPCLHEIAVPLLMSLFRNVLIDFKQVTDNFKQLILKKKISVGDIKQYVNNAYCFKSRQIPIRNPDGSISYVHEVPINVIIKDFFKYIKYEPNKYKKKKYLKELISQIMYVTESFDTDKKYNQELERRLKKAYELLDIDK